MQFVFVKAQKVIERYTVYTLICTCIYIIINIKTLTLLFLGPGAPSISNATSLSAYSVFIAWDAPKLIYGAIDFYYVEVWKVPTDQAQQESEVKDVNLVSKNREKRSAPSKELVKNIQVLVQVHNGRPAYEQEVRHITNRHVDGLSHPWKYYNSSFKA